MARRYLALPALVLLLAGATPASAQPGRGPFGPSPGMGTGFQSGAAGFGYGYGLGLGLNYPQPNDGGNGYLTGPPGLTSGAYYHAPPPAPPSYVGLPNPLPTGGVAHLQFTVPENAELWFEGRRSAQTGRQRAFVSPALAPGSLYGYTVTMRAAGPDGRPIEETREIRVRAGDSFNIDLTRPAR